MGRSPSNYRQEDVQRGIKACKNAGLEVVRVEIEPKTAKIVIVVKEAGTEQIAWSHRRLPKLPTPWSGKDRK